MVSLYKINYNIVGRGISGESADSEYDLREACSVCGTGARLIGPLKIQGFTNINKDIFCTISRDDLISERLYRILLDKNLKIGNLHQVVNTKSILLQYYYLSSEYILPKFSEKTTGYEIDEKAQCKICRRNCFFGIPHVELKLHYDGIDKHLIENSDIFQTWENFGYSFQPDGRHNLLYARPSLIVTQNFKDVIDDLKKEEKKKYRHVLFFPVDVDKFPL